VKIVVRISTSGVLPTKTYFQCSTLVRCRITRRQIDRQREIIARLCWVVTFRADIDFENWSWVDYEKRTSRIGNLGIIRRNRAVYWICREAVHRQEGAGCGEQESYEDARRNHARFRTRISFHDELRIGNRTKMAVSGRRFSAASHREN